MDIGLAITGAVLGSAGLFGLIQFFVSRHDNNSKERVMVREQLARIEQKCDRNEQATTRLQLILLIENHPENQDTILQTAQRYFIELKGNGEAWAVFHRWAEEKKLDTSWYRELISRKEKK